MARSKLSITKPLPGTVEALPDFLKNSAKHLLPEPPALAKPEKQAAVAVKPATQGVTTLKVKKVHPDAVIPKLATSGAACFDLHAVDVSSQSVTPNQPVKIRTGLAFEIPSGYALMVYSRSGHGFKSNTRLSNCVGVIDSDYRGEVIVSLYRDKSASDNSLTSVAVKFNTGDRVAQAMLIEVPHVAFEEVTELGTTDRGEGGFGSTG